MWMYNKKCPKPIPTRITLNQIHKWLGVNIDNDNFNKKLQNYSESNINNYSINEYTVTNIGNGDFKSYSKLV